MLCRRSDGSGSENRPPAQTRRQAPNSQRTSSQQNRAASAELPPASVEQEQPSSDAGGSPPLKGTNTAYTDGAYTGAAAQAQSSLPKPTKASAGATKGQARNKGGMEEYEGSPELDVDLELLAVYEKRLERAIRCTNSCGSCSASKACSKLIAEVRQLPSWARDAGLPRECFQHTIVEATAMQCP